MAQVDLRSPSPGVRYERRPDGIVVITLDRPARGNSLAPGMRPSSARSGARCATTPRSASRS